ncbi:MAG: heme ABC transporter ATP-binding protein [Pseudomonadota bacterium]
MSLRCENASVTIGSASILRDVSLSCERGVFTALIGPNGAGKSTLLKALAGQLHLTAGSVFLDESPLGTIDKQQLARRRAVMTQNATIVFDFRVEEVLALGVVGSTMSDAQFREATAQLCVDCDIEHLLTRSYNTLSGGEQQRVQFARALLQLQDTATDGQDQYLLLDEPTSSLDLSHELTLLKRAAEAAAGGIGVLAVMHDLNLAARFAQRIAILQHGELAAFGSPSEVLQDELLSAVYSTPVQVEQHAGLQRLVIHT